MLDTKAAAEWLGFSPETLAYWRSQRKRVARGIRTRYFHGGPPFVKLGNSIRYWESELVKWVLEKGRHHG
jgi:hypothetical protein